MVCFRKLDIIDLQKKDIKITLTLSAISTSFTRFYSTFYTSFSLRDAMQWLHIWLALCIAYITANLYQLGNQVKHNAIPSLWRSWFFQVKIKQLSKTTLWKKVGLRTEFVKNIQAKTGTECLFIDYWSDLKKTVPWIDGQDLADQLQSLRKKMKNL